MTEPHIHVLFSNVEEVRREPVGEMWCFHCRKRLPHDAVLLDYPPDMQPTYYDPIWVYRCSECGGDHTRFPS